ncbi:DDE-type integrase/transposase/recombinase [Siccirubricoccus sp. G192]|uniref:DDE-type integrase/transposase/recombinase n=1 Tax=Siccirubricoccus sp. G192 TaxID=2849651 RepID=UPI0035C7E533
MAGVADTTVELHREHPFAFPSSSSTSPRKALSRYTLAPPRPDQPAASVGHFLTAALTQAFFRSARAATGVTPDQITTDGHGSYPRAIRSTLGRRVLHRTSAYKNNRLEQDHRGVKGRIRCMRGFKSLASAGRFCRSHDELRNLLRPRTRHNQHVPASRRRRLHLRRAAIALAILETA